MHTSPYPPVLRAPTLPGAVPCFVLAECQVVRRPRPIWDRRCTAILTRLAARHGNAEVADLIAAETGMRFKEKTVSEHRAALGLDSPNRNDWTTPLRRWKPWQGA
jgi:hypothetical protein